MAALAQIRPIGGGNPCVSSQPEITASYGCGGVVTFTISPVNSNASYDWDLGNGSTATGPGPITAVYPGAGPYTVTVTMTIASGNTVCQVSSSAAVTPNQGGGCCPSTITPTQLLGSIGTTTVLRAGVTYSGSYRVLGNLLLTNGTYTLTPGTIFYVDGQATKTPKRQVTGATITLGVNASLVLDNATITASGSGASCPMWGGLILDNKGQGPNSLYRLTVKNHSTISHAYYGINMDDAFSGAYAGSNAYLIDQSTFAYNYTHIRDVSYHPSGQPSLITNCTFDSTDPTQMHFPYDQPTASDPPYYTYQALFLTPGGDTYSHAVEVRGNTINQAVYGIVNYEFDRAGVLIEGNTLGKIFQTGIWTVNNDSDSGNRTPVTSGNQIGLNDNTPNTDQINPTATRYGILGEGQRAIHPNAFVSNTVSGTSNFNVSYRQVGLSIYGQTDASGNRLQNLDEGIGTAALDGSDIFDNRVEGCVGSFVMHDYGNSLNQLNRLGCNTFAQGYMGPTSNTVGIVAQGNVTVNDIGDFSNPAANQFDGLAYGIENDNLNASITYYRTNSPQEAVIVNSSIGNVTVYTSLIRRLSNYCFSQRGATHGNGVNRVTNPSAGYLTAIMDSVRRQLVAPARSRDYLYEVVSYHASTQQLPALETWWATLAVPNAAAYRTVGRYLLGAYDIKQAPAAAQRILLGLQPQALLDAELAAQLQLRAVLRHLPQTRPRLLAADSTVLRTLAWSGTSVAEQAGYWLRYFHPRLPVPPAPGPGLRPAAARPPGLAERGAVLGAAYPNPAQTDVTIACQLAQADQAAELRFTNLLTGQVARVVPVEGTGTARSQRVALAGLPAGQYVYQLVVDGQLATHPQHLTVTP